jgi:hexosaminidase
MVCEVTSLALPLLFAAGCLAADVSAAKGLRLIPFPKSARLEEGGFRLEGDLSIAIGREPADRFAAENLCEEIRGRTKAQPRILDGLPSLANGVHTLEVRPGGVAMQPADLLEISKEGGDEAYALRVSPSGVVIQSRGSRGLFWGVQTLKQLIRANMRDGAIPCLVIHDWPSVRYRGFQDDITRGPSPRLETLKREIRLGAEVKQNFFTYYIEYQYAFSKHPEIGPGNGSLTPEELKELVGYAEPYHVEIIGNQQSFGHFEDILRHDRYAPLRETPSLLCPTVEESYQLLDDLYSEQVPLLKSPFFNVCCDETWGLGTGPSKSLAEKIGVGGVYARHLRRIHDLLRDKYGKRMMMWGDIILQHPEHLNEIPKDTVMLTWGYDARDSFDNQIIPFARSGYEFFVCPGVSCWVWILPDFGVAVKNIQNFVRDGAKHGAIGVLNTTWDDDGENFFDYNWHGVLWGAECAWNASKTDIGDFNRRFGAILLGEDGDNLGRAIEALSRAHRLRGYDGMRDRAFWQLDPGKTLANAETARSDAAELLRVIDPAIERLRAARADAKVNAGVVDYLIFGAERMKLMATRTLTLLDAAGDYSRACQAGVANAQASGLIAESIAKIREIRDSHSRMKEQYSELWLRESKPYALDIVQNRFDTIVAAYDSLLGKMKLAAEALSTGENLPLPSNIGLEIKETAEGDRNQRSNSP